MKAWLIVWLVGSNLGWTLAILVARWRDRHHGLGLGTLYLVVLLLAALYALPGLLREAWL